MRKKTLRTAAKRRRKLVNHPSPRGRKARAKRLGCSVRKL